MVKTIVKKFLHIVLFLGLPAAAFCAIAVDASVNTKVVANYETFEITVKPQIETLNPYDYSLTSVKAVFRGPAKEVVEVDGFYMKEYSYDPEAADVTEGEGVYKIRFTPKRAGTWLYSFTVFEGSTRVYKSRESSFYVNRDKSKRGFVGISRSDPLFFSASDGSHFFPSGVVLDSISDKNYEELEKFIMAVKAASMNTVKLVLSSEGFWPEWTQAANNYDKSQRGEYMLDMLMELCEREKIRVIISLFSYRDFVPGNWEKNPYNAVNSGPLKSPEAFYSDPVALKMEKNRIRYMVARWGASAALLGWELVEFPDFVEPYAQPSVISWHKTMAPFVKKYDAHRHLVSACYFNPYNEPSVYYMKEIDFTQSTLAVIREPAQRVYEISKFKTGKFAKPHLVSGFSTGLEAGEHVKTNEEEAEILHDTIWSGTFTLSAGTPLVDEYMASKDTAYASIKILNALTADIQWPTDDLYDLEEPKLYYKFFEEDKPRDLVIYATDTPAGMCENLLVKEDGKVINKDRFCSSIGGDKPERFFSFKNAVPVKFKIGIGAAAGDNSLVINHNGEEIKIEQVKGEKKFKYREISVDIPIGDNEVKIINNGTGTVYVDSVTITDYLNPKDPPVFASGMQSEKALYMWVKNLSSTALKTISYDAKGLKAQRYRIKFYNTRTGALLKEYEDIADKETLKITFPEFDRDVFVKVERFKK